LTIFTKRFAASDVSCSFAWISL